MDTENEEEIKNELKRLQIIKGLKSLLNTVSDEEIESRQRYLLEKLAIKRQNCN